MQTYHITENGFSMTNDKVVIPECYVKASSFFEAQEKISNFLSTKQLTADIELITPIERIDFE